MTEKGLLAAKNAAGLLGTNVELLVEAITTRATKIPGITSKKIIPGLTLLCRLGSMLSL